MSVFNPHTDPYVCPLPLGLHQVEGAHKADTETQEGWTQTARIQSVEENAGHHTKSIVKVCV